MLKLRRWRFLWAVAISYLLLNLQILAIVVDVAQPETGNRCVVDSEEEMDWLVKISQSVITEN